MGYLVIDAEGWHGDTIRVWASHETLAAARKDVSGRRAYRIVRGEGREGETVTRGVAQDLFAVRAWVKVQP
jgi:hypothetical protein